MHGRQGIAAFENEARLGHAWITLQYDTGRPYIHASVPVEELCAFGGTHGIPLDGRQKPEFLPRSIGACWLNIITCL